LKGKSRDKNQSYRPDNLLSPVDHIGYQ